MQQLSIDKRLCPVSGQSQMEEWMNCLTHGAGFIGSIVGLVLLLLIASYSGATRHLISCAIYGTTLILLYGASTWYHGCSCPKRKRILKNADHACIYLLIAGSYTPFAFGPIKGALGWTLFGIIWGIAATGVLLKVFDKHLPRWQGALIYLGMGWISMIAIGPLRENLSTNGLYWMFGGGLAYSVGVIFYLWEHLPFNHALWHLFVLTGSLCHFACIALYVVPVA